MRMTFVRRLTLVVALAALPAVAFAQPATSFTPVPCPDQAGEYTDSSFAPLPGARAFAGGMTAAFTRSRFKTTGTANWCSTHTARSETRAQQARGCVSRHLSSVVT